jgi:hypothetical protein
MRESGQQRADETLMASPALHTRHNESLDIEHPLSPVLKQARYQTVQDL